jgi:uncharacterized protein YfkK (UPF0435 family)
MCDTDVVLDSVYKKIDAIVFSPESNDYKVSRIKDVFSHLYDSFAEDVKSYIRLCEPIRNAGETLDLENVKVNFLYHNLLMFLLQAPNEITDALYRCPFIANAMPGISTAEILVSYLGCNTEEEKPIQITSTAVLNTYCLLKNQLGELQKKIDETLLELKDFEDLDAEELKYFYNVIHRVMHSSPVEALVPHSDSLSVKLIAAMLMNDTLTKIISSMNKHKELILTDSYIMTTSEENRAKMFNYYKSEYNKCIYTRNITTGSSLIAPFFTEYNRGLRYPVISPSGYTHIINIDTPDALNNADIIYLLKNACNTNYTEAQLYKSGYMDYISKCAVSDEKYVNSFCSDYDDAISQCDNIYYLSDSADVANYRMSNVEISKNAGNYLYTLGSELTPMGHVPPDIFFYLAKGNIQPICIKNSWQNDTMYYSQDFPSAISISLDNYSIYNGTSTLEFVGYAPYSLDKETYTNPLVNGYMTAAFDLIPHNIHIGEKEENTYSYISEINNRLSAVNDGYGVLFPNDKNISYEFNYEDRITCLDIDDDMLNDVFKNRYIGQGQVFNTLVGSFLAIMQLAYDELYPSSLIGYGKKDFSFDENRVSLLREICNIIAVSLFDAGITANSCVADKNIINKLNALIEQFIRTNKE